MESEHGIKPRGIADITLFPRPPLHSFGVTIAQVVIDHGGEICRRQGQAGMGTNIAGTAGNQNSRADGMVAPECAAADLGCAQATRVILVWLRPLGQIPCP